MFLLPRASIGGDGDETRAAWQASFPSVQGKGGKRPKPGALEYGPQRPRLTPVIARTAGLCFIRINSRFADDQLSSFNIVSPCGEIMRAGRMNRYFKRKRLKKTFLLTLW